LDMGFEPQINKILSNVRPDRQTVLFSATFPKKMESLARKALTKPIEILVGGRSVVAAEITQVIEVRTEETKLHRVLELFGELYENDEDALVVM
jgi:ATP-dependent RNA helicase DDX46/PRP5